MRGKKTRKTKAKGHRVHLEPQSVGIIGAGWYGIHLALQLKKSGFTVVLYDKNKDILSGVSGTFGIRTHTSGLHYPRSSQSRAICKRNFVKFAAHYPELLVKTKYSIHALMGVDAHGNHSKVGVEEFKSVCQEDPTSQPFNATAFGFRGVQEAVTIDEPSILVGEPLREVMRSYLVKKDIPFVCNYSVQELRSNDEKVTVIGANGISRTFDHVINATGFQRFLPENFQSNPFGLEVRYQPCVGLIYEDMHPEEEPFMFLGLDGAHWAAMPAGENRYVVTHGIYTILGSCENPSEAHMMLSRVTDLFIERKVRSQSEQDIARYWPGFSERFEYKGWTGKVQAKCLTEKEFRCALTFAKDGVIHVFPGKVSNVIDTGREVKAIIRDEGCSSVGGYRYVDNGVLVQASEEIQEKPTGKIHNTCMLNPYPELLVPSAAESSKFSLFHTSGHEKYPLSVSLTPQFSS